MKFRFLLLLIFFLIEGTVAGAACKKPTITVPMATPDSTGQQETITWTTDVAADSLVGYGLANAGTLTSITDLTGVTSHSVTIRELIPTASYNWVIRSRAINGRIPCGYQYYAFYNGPGGTSFTTASPPAGTFDYEILPVGPHHVTQGHGMYYGIRIAGIQGTYAHSSLTLQLTGLPNFSSVRWTDAQVTATDPDTITTTTVTGDTANLYNFGPGPVVGEKEVYILTNVGGTTPPGNYTITMTGTGSDLPTHTATWALTVDSAANAFSGVAFPYGTPSSYPAIPNLATYKASASTYGAFNCAEDYDASPRTIRPNNEANLVVPSAVMDRMAWFYDGVLGYWNISNMLGDVLTWKQCRDNIKQVYRDNYIVNGNHGGTNQILMFSEGYYKDYLATGEANDLTLINDIDRNMYAPYHGGFVDPSYLQRESAYALRIAVHASKLGQNNPRYGNQTTNFWREYLLDHVLGQVDQICLSQNAQYFESFMVGLQAEALDQYYTLISHDPRIPPAMKCLADYMFSNVYNVDPANQGAFPYDWLDVQIGAGPGTGASCTVVLDMLIVPIYAWVFKYTGLTAYQTEGDEIWSHGVLFDGCQNGLNNNLGSGNGPPSGNSGKEFSQQYYWGPSYVAWRSPPGIVNSDPPAPPTGLKATVH